CWCDHAGSAELPGGQLTPAARLAALAELLAEIEVAAAPAEQLVAAYFRARRFAGSKDRRWITERLYRALRRLGELGGAATELGLVPGPRAQALLSLLLFEIGSASCRERVQIAWAVA